MAPARTRKRARSPSLFVEDVDEEVQDDSTRRKSTRKKSNNWDSWQDTNRAQEADRARQFLNTFQRQISAKRSTAWASLQTMAAEADQQETAFRKSVQQAYGGTGQKGTGAKEGSLPLQKAGDELLEVFRSLVQTHEAVSTAVTTAAAAATGTTTTKTEETHNWDKDLEEARKMVQYGRVYGASLVHAIVVPGKQDTAAVTANAEEHLNQTGRLALGLFPRSRAAVASGQTWGETARKQVQAFQGLAQTIRTEEEENMGMNGYGRKMVTFDC